MRARSTILGPRRSRLSPRIAAGRSGASCSPSLLCPTCLPTTALPAPFCCSALLLASLRRSIIDELSGPGRRHSQQGCWGRLYAACGGSPVPGGELRLVRSPSSIFEQNGVPQVVMQPRCVGRKRVARAWAAQARCGRMPRGGSSAQEALLKASGGRGSVRARRCSLA